MKKNLLWMLAAILACGSMFTSCTNGVDNPVTPIPDPGPDEAGMFIQNVLSDGRYTKDYMGVQGDGIDYLRLDVGSYEEALVEFMKLLPEGVAATAYEETVKGADSAVGFVLNAPMNNDLDSIVIAKIKEPLVPMTGYAWVYLTPDIQKALNVKMITVVKVTARRLIMPIIILLQPDPPVPPMRYLAAGSMYVIQDRMRIFIISCPEVPLFRPLKRRIP